MQLFCKNLQKKFLIGLILLIQWLFMQNVFAQSLSPIGYWQTIDDETNKPRSIVQIWEQGGELRGKVIKIFYQPGEVIKNVCTKCTGPNHNKTIIGMTFLWGMRQNDDTEWSGGSILDPKNGEIYRCNMTLSPDGQQLKVRGYIGVPLIGRSQVWWRQPDVNAAG